MLKNRKHNLVYLKNVFETPFSQSATHIVKIFEIPIKSSEGKLQLTKKMQYLQMKLEIFKEV